MRSFFIIVLMLFQVCFSKEIKLTVFALSDAKVELLKQQREKTDHQITVFNGNPFSLGEKEIIDLNQVKIDFATVGKGVFSKEISLIKSMLKKFNFRFLCSNLLSSDESLFPEDDKSMIFDFEGIKIGVFSLAENAKSNKNCPVVISNSFVAKEKIKKLKAAGADVIIAFIPEKESSSLLKQNQEIDIIISFDAKDTMTFYNHKTLIYNFAKGSSLSRIDLVIEKKNTVRGKVINLYPY